MPKAKYVLDNIYDNIDQKYNREIRNYPNEKITNIPLNFRILITGPTRSGKTSSFFNLLKIMGFPFNRYYLIAGDIEEPIYKQFRVAIKDIEKKTGTNLLTVSNNIDDVPLPTEIDPKLNTLVIIDDMGSESDKKLKKVADLFMQGAKRNCSVAFFCHNYHDDKDQLRTMKKNTNIFIFKLIDLKQMKSILADFAMDKSTKQLLEMYQEALSDDPFLHFFLIDRQTNDPKLRYRKNLG